MNEENVSEIGRITHFFPKICVAVVELKGTLKVGDRIAVKGPTTDFEQPSLSSFCISGTSADSDEDVPRTVRSSGPERSISRRLDAI